MQQLLQETGLLHSIMSLHYNKDYDRIHSASQLLRRRSIMSLHYNKDYDGNGIHNAVDFVCSIMSLHYNKDYDSFKYDLNASGVKLNYVTPLQ